ncbi:histone acetyltransferase HAC1 isoform X2 [Neltuma alba]|uniref:histone acetyltransferase HAC1 isoform X2 n=1 Tax=Neltuma alba TaxID=207710 RepID=UPI0010A35307|nr:histone acetyltransferase HAC1-like isoform X2 [Prosopis alba]
MELQAHISGQVPNQAGSQLPGLAQTNGNALPPQIPNLGGIPRSTINTDPEFLRARFLMQEKINDMLLQRQPHPVTENNRRRCRDFAKRLEEGMLRSARSKEEHLNMETLESRLMNCIKRSSASNHNQQYPQTVSSSQVGTMIPTPGMSHVVSSSMASTPSVEVPMIASSGYNSMPSSSINSGNMYLHGNLHGNSLRRVISGFANGYQQSSTGFSVGSGGNMSSMGVQRNANQMIPSPGFTSSSHSYTNVESSNNSNVFSNVDSTMVSQSQQKPHVGGQNNNVMQNLGNQMGSGMRSGLQQKSFAYSNGAMTSGLGSVGNNMQAANESGTTDGYATAYGNSPKQLQQHFDQNQQPPVQSDGYGLNNVDSFASGNFYSSATSSGSIMSSQNMNSTKLPVISKTNSLINSHSSLHGMQQAALLKSQAVNQLDKVNFQSSSTSRDGLLHHQQQCQQRPQQFQQPEQYVQQQFQLKMHSQQPQHLVNNDAFSRSQATSNLESKVKSEPGVEHHQEVLNSQVSGQFHISGMQNQFRQKTAEDCSKNAQHLPLASGQNDFSTRAPQNSQEMLHSQHLTSQSGKNFSWPSAGTQSNSAYANQWNSQPHDVNHITGNTSQEQLVQSDFHQRISRLDEAQCNNLSSDPSIVGQAVASRGSAEPQVLGVAVKKAHRNQQRWLLFLLHARRCPAPEGQCQERYCYSAQKLCRHIEGCELTHCSYPRCHHTRLLLRHFKNCKDPCCPVCVFVRNYRHKLKSQIQPGNNSGMPVAVNGYCQSYDTEAPSPSLIPKPVPVIETSEDLQPSQKRMKIEQSIHSLSSKNDNSAISFSAKCHSDVSKVAQCQDYAHCETSMPIKPELTEVKEEVLVHLANEKLSEVNVSNMEGGGPTNEPVTFNDSGPENIKTEKETGQDKPVSVTQPSENASSTKSGKPTIKGVSLIELFTPEQVREHITGLRQWVGQSKAKAEKNQAMEHLMSENSCQLCAVEKLTFEPPPIYCSTCGARIKRNAMYYTMGAGDTRHYFCIPCYNEARGDSIVVDGSTIPKGRLEKKKNDEETEEWWVQCDKCEAWQHQICALFNGRRNDGGQAEYTCPNCYIQEVERGERKPLPQSAVLGAKDLPRTILSDHIEQRLFRKLKQERQERARLQGKSYDEVPGAESLVIRVVSSVDKKLEVKQRFLEIFQDENYPTEFPYKSKVILLFQKIEGVEVCLFGMYVQEFGSECQFPNQRRVYLSYLDSVKYFRPEVKAVTGDALRTFVYHEILIGYLDYCKKRGFTSCYIWACPPLKGEDYILYCHPEIQKTPKSDKLREWYLAMLRKAAKDDIVVDLTNLYDHFFVSTGECRAKVTAARLPYFDGDYWPGAAEDLIYQLRQEEDGRKQNKKGTTKKTITKRALKASGQTDLSGNASKDLLLMHKLGETISPMKEDFIMVHLQHACSHCCILMVSGNRWVCNQCKNFQICDKCYEAEQKREERERHPINQREKHALNRIEIIDVLADTKDKDEILESEFFDTRQAFLSLCQGNHYQYDTLRRAKHSSMMVLYHLHNPTAPAFVTTCNICYLDIETGQGWRCEVCPEYDVCNACYQKGGIDHPHKLTNHPSLADRDAQNKEARQLRVLQLRKMLDLLVHASQCRSPHCQYPNCRKVKGLFRHGIQCKTRASGGCVLCKKMWYLLQLHARACKESECHVPRCRDLKEHLRRLQQQSESRRRAAVNEMMRQRAAEVANNAG